ncbi:error-prone DNA polymerase [Ferrimonas balearica]|uniref:error-prone DNA polymerase n=1 Tax=Ferrimonas balearica TaxID=44012 RepID=UPI001C9940CD|nr:error-prone DNA polymerase [Ferrimonas balearica]MBY5920069.1 error-prone DNA polymerase [Ferrimonas balearica]MBY5997246.1 error-prone DNA polymerase [Ferrimonas balearica]
MGFAQLRSFSNFSFLQGASHPEELVEQAAALGYRALALTDECSLAGVVKAHMAAKAQGLKLIVGSEFVLAEHRLVLLAMNRIGYGELSALISTARRRSEKGQYRLNWEDLGQPNCLLLWSPPVPEQAQERGAWLAERFPDRLYLMAERLLRGGEGEWLLAQQQLGEQLGRPLVAADPVRMHEKSRQPLLDALTCIRLGCALEQAGGRVAGNAEAYLKPQERLAQRHRPAWRETTTAIAGRCHFSLDELRYEYPAELVPEGMGASEYLRQETMKGARQRFGDTLPEPVRRQLEQEFSLIDELGYHYFFLTIYDIVQFAKAEGILHQGRGSAANSVVCYCLGITEVDPTKVNLLFERFLSRERDEPPDIDVDFEHQRREEVIQYIYRKYGRDRAALAATVISYRFKSAMRDLGKVLGIEEGQIERWIRGVDRRDPTRPWQEQLRTLGLSGRRGELLLTLVAQLLGFPRHLSQHVGGFVISAGPLSELVPVENAAMAERTVIQWDKDDLEALGLLKVDILALGMLSAIRRCLALVGEWQKHPMQLSDVVWEEPEVYDMLCHADSIGVFQIESRAQSNMLPRLRPRCYYDLVVQIAIVRPGPIQGDMVHPYLKRRHGLEPVSYPSEAVREVLERTLGVPIFQEQVIKLAMVAAGFSGGEADQLRRAMASWKRHGELEKFERKLKGGMAERGYSAEFADQIFRQIRGFGEYGFPESHSASFALLAYASAWLKYHYPVAFTCALLNSQPMGFYTPSQLVQDLQRHGGVVRPVSVNHSQWDHQLEAVEGEMALRLGLRLVKGLSRRAAEALLAARPDSGFTSVHQLVKSAGLDRGALEALASANALADLAGHRHQARWLLAGEAQQLPLFAECETGTQVSLTAPEEAESILADYHQLGLSLGRHPLSLLREQGALARCLTAAELLNCRHGQLVQLAGLVVGRQRPGTASGVTFITLEDETGNANVVVWADTARAQRQPYLTARLLKVNGILEREGEVIHVIAGRLEDWSERIQKLAVRSRDFR